jgi:hypothetical protein
MKVLVCVLIAAVAALFEMVYEIRRAQGQMPAEIVNLLKKEGLVQSN